MQNYSTRSFPNQHNLISLDLETSPEAPPICECKNIELRVRTYANGTQHYVHQCLSCGRQASTALKKSAVPEPTRCKPFDEALLSRQEEERRAHYDFYRQQRALSARDWWDRYDKYLLTPEWQMKRDKVLRRDKNLCQGCFVRPAISAHHLTYKHVGCEFLFELVSVCAECHGRLHSSQDRTRVPV